MLRLYPWLRQYTGGSADGHEGGKETPSGAEVAAAVAAEPDDVEALDDEAAARLFEELEAKRDEAVDRAGESRDFTTEIRGGRWTMEHRGVAADSERAKAANRDAETWCRSYSLPLSFTCAYSAYSDEVCSMLCLAWARKMQFFYDIATARGPAHCYTDADVAAYQEDDGFTVWADLQIVRSVLNRVDQIRGIRPREPRG